MMKIIILILSIALVLAIIICDFEIKTNPFSFKITHWEILLCIYLIFASFFVTYCVSYSKGYKNGVTESLKTFNKS